MEKYEVILKTIVGTVVLLLIVVFFYKGAGWLFVDILLLTPKRLAIAMLFVAIIPVIGNFIYSFFSPNAPNSSIAYYSILILPIAFLGLFIAGVWYLFS